MCGIALILGPRPDRQAFGRMLAAVAPRGEVEETRLTERLLAGTQRLRIVDAERAIQPFTSADGRWVLCYNGEVFNYRVLQAELTRLGHRLRTDSDTEVVLEAFLEWGADAVTRLRGEFAFALADTAADRVYLARDPLGVKPLYWSRAGGGLHVASEIKALTGLGAPVSEVPRDITAGLRAVGRSRAARTRRPDRSWTPTWTCSGSVTTSRRSRTPTRPPSWSGPPWRTASGCGSTPA